MVIPDRAFAELDVVPARGVDKFVNIVIAEYIRQEMLPLVFDDDLVTIAWLNRFADDLDPKGRVNKDD
jgi:hypothetical protein